MVDETRQCQRKLYANGAILGELMARVLPWSLICLRLCGSGFDELLRREHLPQSINHHKSGDEERGSFPRMKA